ncbi:unnamed protein product, partial [Allacma fusca]
FRVIMFRPLQSSSG